MTADVSVDRDFARFGSKSYAINKINTVEVRESKPNKADGGFVLFIVAALIFIYGFWLPAEETVACAAMAIGLMVWAYFIFMKSKIVEYQLFLRTSSSESQAFVSEDPNEVADLRDRIESAMTRR